ATGAARSRRSARVYDCGAAAAGTRGERTGHMTRRKIVVAMMMHETNTFSPVPTPLSSFRPLAGVAAIEEFRDTNTQLGGFPRGGLENGAGIVVPGAGGAHPS